MISASYLVICMRCRPKKIALIKKLQEQDWNKTIWMSMSTDSIGTLMLKDHAWMGGKSLDTWAILSLRKLALKQQSVWNAEELLHCANISRNVKLGNKCSYGAETCKENKTNVKKIQIYVSKWITYFVKTERWQQKRWFGWKPIGRIKIGKHANTWRRTLNEKQTQLQTTWKPVKPMSTNRNPFKAFLETLFL